jgi:copper chaperone CopZ
MTHTYQVTGMTCSACEAKVKNSLQAMSGVSTVTVSKENSSATISMEKHITMQELQAALGGPESKYQISAMQHHEIAEQAKSWLKTYQPILLIFAYTLGVSTLTAHHWMDGMRYFMAAFFLVFSFFKLLNIRDFADSYAMYDIVAKRFPIWGFIYPFVELALGLAFLINFQPRLTNIATLLVMGISAVGVIQSVLNKRKIRCACLGVVFNLPMSTVTIIEDLLMVAMSALMLILN